MAKTVERTVSERVRRLRKEKGLYQHELAARAGVSAQTVRNIEAGRKEPEARTLRGIAKGLGVSFSELAD